MLTTKPATILSLAKPAEDDSGDTAAKLADLATCSQSSHQSTHNSLILALLFVSNSNLFQVACSQPELAWVITDWFSP